MGTSEILAISISDTYTLVVTNQNNGCSSSDQVIVSQDIIAPIADAGNDGTITCINDTYELDASNSTGDNLAYSWYDNTGNLINSNIAFTTSNFGDYTLVVTNTLNGCSAVDELSVFENTLSPLASADANGMLTCLEDEVSLSGSASSGTDLDFAWFNQSGQLISTEINTVVNAAGNYTLLLTDLSNGCQQSDIVEVLTDVTAPLAVASTITNISCEEETGLISGDGSSTGSNFTYQWIGPGTILDSLAIETAVDTEGLFNLQVTNTTNGCTAIAQTAVIQSSDFPGIPELNLTGPYCFGDLATLMISDVTGGNSPYLYSVNGGDSFQSGNIFTDLPSALYEVLIEDSEGCLYAESLLVPEADELFIDLETTLNLEYGSTQQLNAFVNLAPEDIASIQWSPASGLSCTDCLSPSIVFAAHSTRYAITITDINGCQTKASILIAVENKQDVYIPSAFSPNGDNNNDVFMIFSSEKTIREITYFRVFNRWGALIYENFDGQANDTSYGWDGTKNGEKLNPDVFVYVAEVIWNDGTTGMLKGDVTLME
ncbi:MAG: gliding motility-associated-like protein [Polaribacter sp.]